MLRPEYGRKWRPADLFLVSSRSAPNEVYLGQLIICPTASNLSFSQITTGNWSVTLIGSNFTLERDFYLVAGPVQTVTYTVTPTVIVGYTTTPIASSKTSGRDSVR